MLMSYMDTHSNPSLPLGGHLSHAVLILGGALVFLLLVARLYYREFKRTGQWSLKDLNERQSTNRTAQK